MCYIYTYIYIYIQWYHRTATFQPVAAPAKVAFAALPAEPMIPRASDARCQLGELWLRQKSGSPGKPSMAEILCLHMFLSLFLKKKIEDFERQDGKHDETWNDGVLFFPKKKSQGGLLHYTYPGRRTYPGHNCSTAAV